MMKDQLNYIYYAVKHKGQIRIMEINPKMNEPKNHLMIFEMKTKRCLGLSCWPNGNRLYFIDENKNIHHLERMPYLR